MQEETRETKEILLIHPIEIDGKKISTLTMKRPFIGDLRAVWIFEENMQEMMMACNLCGLNATVEEIDKWPLSVFFALRGAIQGFLTR